VESAPSIKLVENGSRLRPAAELRQGQGLLESQITQHRRVARRGRAVQERHRLGSPLSLQKINRQIEPRSDIVRCALDAPAQKSVRVFRFPADPHEGTEIDRCGRVVWLGGERPSHSGLGAFIAPW
jgi:hypothetical protein